MSDSAAELFLSGVARLNQDDVDGAIQFFSDAIQADPNFAPAYNYRGYAKALIVDASAGEDFTMAVRLLHDYADAYFNRGYYIKDTDSSGAIADFTSAIKNIATYTYGNYYHLSQRYDPYIQRAEMKFSENKFTDAISDYTDALLLQPSDGNLFLRRAAAYLKDSNHKQTVEDCTQAIKLLPNDTSHLQQVGEAYYLRGTAKNALRPGAGSQDLATARNFGYPKQH